MISNKDLYEKFKDYLIIANSINSEQMNLSGKVLFIGEFVLTIDPDILYTHESQGKAFHIIYDYAKLLHQPPHEYLFRDGFDCYNEGRGEGLMKKKRCTEWCKNDNYCPKFQQLFELPEGFEIDSDAIWTSDKHGNEYVFDFRDYSTTEHLLMDIYKKTNIRLIWK